MKTGLFLSAMVLVGACSTGDDALNADDLNSVEQGIAFQHISDAVNTPGTAGFYWLPAFVSTAPTTTGTFNATYKSHLAVNIVDLDCTTFVTGAVHSTLPSSSVLLYASTSTYRINTSSPAINAVANHCYRVTPTLDGVDIGYRDIYVSTGTAPSGLLRYSPTANIVIQWGMYGNISADGCPSDPNKTAPGACGCGFADVDADSDGHYSSAGGGSGANCDDLCDSNGDKLSPGTCGCGASDTGDSDSDGTLDCVDSCPTDARFQTTTGVCGCNSYSVDYNEDGTPDFCTDANTCTFAP